jgi:hypothetical protein
MSAVRLENNNISETMMQQLEKAMYGTVPRPVTVLACAYVPACAFVLACACIVVCVHVLDLLDVRTMLFINVTDFRLWHNAFCVAD